METYSAVYDQDTLLAALPKFLVIEREVTGDPAYSMYNLSLKEDWKNSKKYYTGGESKASANGKTENFALLFQVLMEESIMRMFSSLITITLTIEKKSNFIHFPYPLRSLKSKCFFSNSLLTF